MRPDKRNIDERPRGLSRPMPCFLHYQFPPPQTMEPRLRLSLLWSTRPTGYYLLSGAGGGHLARKWNTYLSCSVSYDITNTTKATELIDIGLQF